MNTLQLDNLERRDKKLFETLCQNSNILKDFAKKRRQQTHKLNGQLEELLPVLKNYNINDIHSLKKDLDSTGKLKLEPHELLELAYTPSDVIKILGLENDISTHKVTKLMEKHQLFQSPYAKRLYRLADSDRTEKHTSTVAVSILGVIEFYYWYERGKTLQKGLKLIWKEHKEDFIYLSKR